MSRQVKIINEQNPDDATEEVNNFIDQVQQYAEVIDIQYSAVYSSLMGGYNCIMIVYKIHK